MGNFVNRLLQIKELALIPLNPNAVWSADASTHPHPPAKIQLRGLSVPQKIVVLITGKLHNNALEILQNPPASLKLAIPMEIVYRPDCSRDELMALVPQCHVLISRSETDVDAEVIRAAPHLSILARAAVGYGNIDLETATESGILVVNTPGKNTNSAAELTFALLLACIRNLPHAHTSTQAGHWNRHKFTGRELLHRSIGIVGLGNVGHRVAKFAKGFDMQVLGFDPYISEEVFRRHGVQRFDSLEKMVAKCDILTVHTPLNKETKGMIGAKQLSLLKPGAIVLNAARGGIIDEKSILEALESNHISSAGIDTWVNEPNLFSELRNHPNVICSPHIGASTLEAQERIGEAVATQVLKALRQEVVDYPVNLPHVSLLTSNKSRNLAVLAEKLASVASQICEFNPSQLSLKLSPDIPESDSGLLRLCAIKGFVASSSDEYVSYVNAERILAKRGIQMEVELSKEGDVVRSGMVLEVLGARSEETCKVGAVLYNQDLMRLCLINDFLFEIEPNGEMLLILNHDQPGVIGAVGSFLANQNINIAQFELSRNRMGGQAISLVKVDVPLEQEQIAGLEVLPHVIRVKMIRGL